MRQVAAYRVFFCFFLTPATPGFAPRLRASNNASLWRILGISPNLPHSLSKQRFSSPFHGRSKNGDMNTDTQEEWEKQASYSVGSVPCFFYKLHACTYSHTQLMTSYASLPLIPLGNCLCVDVQPNYLSTMTSLCEKWGEGVGDIPESPLETFL